MRHYITFCIVCLKITEDVIQSFSNHIFTAKVQGACVGALREFLEAENLPELVEQCVSVTKTTEIAKQRADKWTKEFEAYMKSSGLEAMGDEMFKNT